jgi:two-component system NtrC family sensor kinase
MSPSKRPPSAYRFSVQSLFWLPAGVSVALVLIAVGALVVLSWRSVARIQPVQAHLAQMSRLQEVGLDFEQTLIRGLRDPSQVAMEQLVALGDELLALASSAQHLQPQTPQRLRSIRLLLVSRGRPPVDLLSETLAQLRRLLLAERRAHDRLLAAVERDSRTELRLAMGLLLGLPAAGAALLFLMRRRIKHPLDQLGALLVQLAERDYRPVPQQTLGDAAPLLLPVLHSYNELVLRLRDLEAEHRDREHGLEREVRAATAALLEQSRELARAERLAAVGAVAAGLAHELRNPLAGIQMACGKLHKSLTDPAQLSRVEAVIGELRRLNGLLSQRVDAARHTPEALTRVPLKETVEAFLVLVRYQVPAGLRLRAEVDPELACLLPEGGLRQALLNLVLNAAQAVDETGGSVCVAASREDGRLLLSVTDDGPGFPPGLLEGGVRPFASGRPGGTGLGLAMVRRFVLDLAGELLLENPPGGGARVLLRLPCTEAPG